jgi:hypothetical protein
VEQYNERHGNQTYDHKRDIQQEYCTDPKAHPLMLLQNLCRASDNPGYSGVLLQGKEEEK